MHNGVGRQCGYYFNLLLRGLCWLPSQVSSVGDFVFCGMLLFLWQYLCSVSPAFIHQVLAASLENGRFGKLEVIIIIIKYIYIAQVRRKKTPQMHQSSQLHVKLKNFLSVPERVHSDVRISQFSRQTVPDSRSLNGETTVAEFCSRSWNTKLTESRS